MIAATYTVEIAWTSKVLGGFVIGVGIVGTDAIGNFTVSGWVDETSNVTSLTITRGSPDDLGQVLSGTCTIMLNDKNGRYNPTNTGSALSPNVIPMRPVRVKATYSGTDYYRFYGYIQTITTEPNRERQEATLTCADMYALLSLSYPIVTANGTTTTTALAITRIIQLCGISDPTLLNLDTGDTIADYSSTGTTSALSQIQSLVTAEGGIFYITRAGVARFENRYARNQAPRTSDQSTIAGTMAELSGISDAAQVYNEARYTRTGGVQQVYNDSTSQGKYGKRVKTLSSSLWVNDAQALNAATFFIGMKKNPPNPVRIKIDGNSSDALMTALLVRDLNDRLGISETRGGTTGSFYIESISETIEGGKLHSAELYCSMRPASFPSNY